MRSRLLQLLGDPGVHRGPGRPLLTAHTGAPGRSHCSWLLAHLLLSLTSGQENPGKE